MLAIASILDIKNREVPDKVWLVFGAAGALLTVFELFDGISNKGLGGNSIKIAFAVHSAIGIAIISAIGYATYKTGLFGGADPKALVAIAVILPTYLPPFDIHGFPALSVLSNALIVSMAAILYNIVRNSISLAKGIPIFERVHEGAMRKALAFAVGFSSTSPGRYTFALEEADDSGARRFRFNPVDYNEFVEVENRRIWVTRALPFIVYLGAGFAIYLVIGDLFALMLRLLII